MSELSNPAKGFFDPLESEALAINDHDQIIGVRRQGAYLDSDQGSEEPVLWQDGRMLLLRGLHGARAINDRGQIVGARFTFTGPPESAAKPVDPGAINDHGQIVGAD